MPIVLSLTLLKFWHVFSKGPHSQSRESTWKSQENKDFGFSAAESREAMHRATRKKKQGSSSDGQWCTKSSKDLYLFESCWGIWTHTLKRSWLPFEQKYSQQATPVKGRNKSNLMYSDSEIKKQTHKSQWANCVSQEMWCALYSFNSLLLTRLHDIDAGAWKVSYCLTALCNKTL